MQVVDLSNGQALHALAQKPFRPLWLDGYGHNDLPPSDCDAYVRDFLGHLEAAAAAALRPTDAELGLDFEGLSQQVRVRPEDVREMVSSLDDHPMPTCSLS